MSTINAFTEVYMLCRMSLAEKAETAAERTGCMDITLWKQYSTSTEEEREAHLSTYLRYFRKQNSGKSNSNATTVLRLYDVSCYLSGHAKARKTSMSHDCLPARRHTVERGMDWALSDR